MLRRHRADDSVSKAIGRLIRADLIVIDDIGMLAVAPDAAEALFRVVDAAYERRSIALTSNIHPAGFDELMPKTLATATVDRLLHHAHVLLTDGTDSYRLAQTTAGKGVIPPQLTRAQRAIAAPPRPTGSAPRRPTRYRKSGRTDGHQRGEEMCPPVGRTHVRHWGETDGR